MPYDYPTKSAEIHARLMSLGLRPDHLMRIGSFIVAYGLFETTLERALWTLSEKNIEGVRPFTETMSTEQKFEMLGKGNPKLGGDANAVLAVASKAADDLNEYRNSLVHGYLLSFGPDSVPSFMKNPHWHGAMGRKKPMGDAYIDEPIQDLVLVAAWSLASLMRKAETAFADAGSIAAIKAMKADIDRARSYAGEARHLRSLMNHEKC